MNRTLVGDIADLHFSPTKANADNLRREAIMGDIFITGNTAIDAMQYTVKPNFVFPTALLNELDFQNHRIIAVTCHRRENYGKPMEDIMHAILEIVETHPDVEVVYPVQDVYKRQVYSIRSRCCSLEMTCAGIKCLLLRFFYSIARISANSKQYEKWSIYLILS